jgi:hypothetical protein
MVLPMQTISFCEVMNGGNVLVNIVRKGSEAYRTSRLAAPTSVLYEPS